MSARFHRFEFEGHPYFVTTVVDGRRPVFEDPKVAQKFIETLYENRARYGVQLLSFVVMPDHVHLLLVPDPRNTVSDVVRHIKGSFAREYNQVSGRSGSYWQRSFYERIVRGEKALNDTLAYIEANPVVAGIVADAEQYEFGSASGRYETDILKYLGGR